HELRTPLTQLRGYADVMDALAQQGQITPEQVSNLTTSLLSASDRLDDIISTMLDASQIDVDAMQLSFDDTSLEKVLRKAVDPYAEAMRERGQSLAVQGLRSVPSIHADRRRLTKAFRHLVNNAIKYTPDGGRVEIRARHLLRSDRRPESVEVLVSDSGVGIDPKYHELVFEKFFRIGSADLHSSGSTKFMGAGPGLGLPIAKGVIVAHGGEIWVESAGFDMEACPGTTVHVILPLKPPALSAAAAAELQKDALNFDPVA
ncbi:MAG: sensor histidine kinase, partial [Anaerolineales bacterium]